MTTSTERLGTRINALAQEVRDAAAKALAEDRDFTAHERTFVEARLAEVRGLRAQYDEQDGQDALAAAVDDIGGYLAGTHANGATGARSLGGNPMSSTKSAGARFTDDADFAAWLKSVGARAAASTAHFGESPAVRFAGLKDILAGGDEAGAGALVSPDHRGLVDATGALQRPLVLRQLLGSGTTTSDLVSFGRVIGFTNNAAPVAEARGTSAGDSSGDVAGTKPESSMEFEMIQRAVSTIAHWLPATKRALADVGQLRTVVDNFLGFGLDEELEDQVVNGDGTGENFEGILAVDGIQTLDESSPALTGALDGATGTLAAIIALRVARRLVRTNGRAQATGILLNPEDNERIELARDENGLFYFGGPAGAAASTSSTLPRVESEAVEPGTAIVADWRQATLWDREQAQILVSDSHADFFIRNLVAILAELRAAFGVVRPSAFVVVDLEAIFGID